MVFALLASYLSATGSSPSGALHNDSRIFNTRNEQDVAPSVAPTWLDEASDQTTGSLEERPPYLHAMLAGGLGGLTGDMLMHSLDTVKTRQQGDPHRPPKYHSLGNTYYTIWRQEGVRLGLYSGVTAAAIGSFAGTVVFFGTYEWSKRYMLDLGLAPSLAYLNAGFVADLVASPIYVPSEVLKTRLQLQGRYNNPHFRSGYNYRSTANAARTIVRAEGFSALFYGYKATLYRDIPFSGLQFAFYEKFRGFAKQWAQSNDIGLPLEVLTAASAGGLAGTITCPLDVVKTRIQTQVNPAASAQRNSDCGTISKSPTPSNVLQHSAGTSALNSSLSSPSPSRSSSRNVPLTTTSRSITTSSLPQTPRPSPGSKSITLDTSSIFTGLRRIYATEGATGLFRGVGPRAVWTSVQTSTMLVLYQVILRYFDKHPLQEVLPKDR